MTTVRGGATRREGDLDGERRVGAGAAKRTLTVSAVYPHANPCEPGDLMFTNAQHAPIDQRRWSNVWRAVADPLGLPRGTGFHALRHHYASTPIRAGESVKVVQERLGHTSATMTLDVYGHLFPDDEDRTRAAVDAVLGPALAAVGSA